jgi:SRSO17 transposase
MPGASIEATLELWASSLREVGRGRWDADALRDMAREYVIEHLADDDAVLVVDETGFLQGKSSCGVARQYTGSAGKITNCQIGVYVLRHRHAFIDRALYLPKSWTDDPARLKATYVPDDVVFATKPHLAARMIDRATATSVPFRWVAGGTVYGVGDIERDLREAGKGCVLGVGASRVSILGQATKHCGNRCGDCPSAGSV